MTSFFYSVRTFASITKHYFSKYWGDGCMGRPHLKFWRDRPPVSLSLRQCLRLALLECKQWRTVANRGLPLRRSNGTDRWPSAVGEPTICNSARVSAAARGVSFVLIALSRPTSSNHICSWSRSSFALWSFSPNVRPTLQWACTICALFLSASCQPHRFATSWLTPSPSSPPPPSLRPNWRSVDRSNRVLLPSWSQ